MTTSGSSPGDAEIIDILTQEYADMVQDCSALSSEDLDKLLVVLNEEIALNKRETHEDRAKRFINKFLELDKFLTELEDDIASTIKQSGQKVKTTERRLRTKATVSSRDGLEVTSYPNKTFKIWKKVADKK